MSKLNPPIIEGVLPTFAGSTLIIPFEHNATVGAGSYSGFVVRVSTLITGTLIGTYKTVEENQSANELKVELGSNINGKGELFSVQVAYKDKPENENEDAETGYYSNTATVKRISSAPVLTCENHGQELIGTVSFNNMTDEVPITYVFNIYNQDGSLFETSGE